MEILLISLDYERIYVPKICNRQNKKNIHYFLISKRRTFIGVTRHKVNAKCLYFFIFHFFYINKGYSFQLRCLSNNRKRDMFAILDLLRNY